MNPLEPPFSEIRAQVDRQRACRERRVVRREPAACGCSRSRNRLRACGWRHERHRTPERQCYPECSHSTSNPVSCSRLRRVLAPFDTDLGCGRPASTDKLRARTDERRSPRRAASHRIPTSRRARPLALRGRWPSCVADASATGAAANATSTSRASAPRTIVAFISRSDSADVRTFAHSPAVSRVQRLQLQAADQPATPTIFVWHSTGAVLHSVVFEPTTEPDARQTILTGHRRPPNGAVRRFTVALWPVLERSSRVYSLPILIGLGARWSARSTIDQLQASNAALQVENASYREATGQLADQVAALQTAVNRAG